MATIRTNPPSALAGIPVRAVRDYEALTVRAADGTTTPLVAPRGDLVILDLAEPGNYVAVRPSGTEPKAKFYMFTFVPAEQLADLDRTRDELEIRLDQLQRDLAQFAESV